jgi:hypothetical protein
LWETTNFVIAAITPLRASDTGLLESKTVGVLHSSWTSTEAAKVVGGQRTNDFHVYERAAPKINARNILV